MSASISLILLVLMLLVKLLLLLVLLLLWLLLVVERWLLLLLEMLWLLWKALVWLLVGWLYWLLWLLRLVVAGLLVETGVPWLLMLLGEGRHWDWCSHTRTDIWMSNLHFQCDDNSFSNATRDELHKGEGEKGM